MPASLPVSLSISLSLLSGLGLFSATPSSVCDYGVSVLLAFFPSPPPSVVSVPLPPLSIIFSSHCSVYQQLYLLNQTPHLSLLNKCSPYVLSRTWITIEMCLPLFQSLCPFHSHSSQVLVSFRPLPPLCVTMEFLSSWLSSPPPLPLLFPCLFPLSQFSLVPPALYISSYIS